MNHLPSESLIIYVLDMVGIFASAAAASVLSKRLGLDVFGAVLVAMVGSVGGGTLRDVLLNRHPIFWLTDLNYFYLIVSTALIVRIFYHFFARMENAVRLFDALGLGAFTVIGMEAALSRNMPVPIVICMGVMTAVAGGILRDVICRQLPLLLHREIYLTAALGGCILYLVMRHLGVSHWFCSIGTMVFIFTFRMLAVYRQWNLPDITLPLKPKI